MLITLPHETTLPAGQPSALELDLSTRARTGDQQALLDLYTALQPRIHQRASRYVCAYRHVLPLYLDAQDLAQEACLVMYQRLQTAHTKDDPVAYLLATGYKVMWCRCVEAMHEPLLASLDRPLSDDDPTPLHERVPSTVLPCASDMREHDDTPLSEALAQLPEEQRALLALRLGLPDQQTQLCPSVHSIRGTGAGLGITTSRVSWQQQQAYTTLYVQLKAHYPHYAEHVLAGRASGRAAWPRIEQAYASLSAEQLRTISGRALARLAGVSNELALAFLHEREGRARPPARQQARDKHLEICQRLEQASLLLQDQGQAITPTALARAAGISRTTTRRFLQQRAAALSVTGQDDHRQETRNRLEQAWARLSPAGQPITGRQLAREAGVNRYRAHQYLKTKGGHS